MHKNKIIILILIFAMSFTATAKIKNMIYNEAINFRGFQLQDAVAILSENTGLTIVVDEANKSKVLDIGFAAGESLENILNTLATANNLKLTEIGPNSYIFEDRSGSKRGGNNLRGIVKLAGYDVGLDGVKITLLDSGVSPVTTGLGGKYILKNVLPGTYIAKFEKQGFITEGEFVAMDTKETRAPGVEMRRDRNNPEKAAEEDQGAAQYGKEQTTDGGRVIERVQLTNLSSEEAKTILEQLMSENSTITPTSKTNSDTVGNDVGMTPQETETAATATPAPTDAGGGLSKNDVSSFDSGPSFRAVSLSKQNIILLNGTIDKVRTAKAILKDLDSNSRQVRISAQVLDITDNLFENLGFNWAYASGAIGSVNLPSGGNGYYPTGYPSENTSVGSNRGLLGAINLNFIRYFNKGQDFLDFSIDMLQRTGDSATSAVPSILVISGDKGVFEVSSTQVESYNSQVSTSVGGATTYTANTGKAGTMMTVTPTVRDDDTILLNIQIENSEYAKNAESMDPTKGDVNTKTTRSIKSNVVVRNGDTIFIGGMKKAKSTYSSNQIPVLGSIPVLGTLFKNQSASKEITDLYIKLKVEIATSENANKEFNLDGLKMKELHQYNNTEKINTKIYPQFKTNQLAPK